MKIKKLRSITSHRTNVYKMKKFLTITLLLFGFSSISIAQQEPQFTQYMLNRLSYNPGVAGASGSMCGMLMYRNQWLGLKLDAPEPGGTSGKTPTDYMFSFDSPVKFLHGGIGLSVYQEEVGYHSNLSAALDYAFRMYWGPGNLAAGIEASLYNMKFKTSDLQGPDDLSGHSGVSGTSTNDPAINNAGESDMLIDMSVGLFYQVPGSYYIGASVKDLLAAKSSVFNYANARTLYIMGGYEYYIPANPSFKLKPGILLKAADFNIFAYEASCLLDYRNAFWGGINMRGGINKLNLDAVSLLGGFNWHKLKLGIAYDLTISALGGYKYGRSVGTAELYLQYCFRIIIPQKPPSIYRNTRYLL